MRSEADAMLRDGSYGGRRALLLTITALCWAGLHTAAHAQVVTGHVVAEGAPVEGALVAAYDSADLRVVAGLTLANGFFRLRLPQPGSYVIRTDRIGYRSGAEVVVQVPPEGTGPIQIVLTPRPIELPKVTANETRRCNLNPNDAELIGAVWEAARIALSGAEWLRETSGYRFRIARWERELNEKGGVEAVVEDTAWTASPVPFRAADAISLHEKGWVQKMGSEDVYFGPSEATLLSPSFLQQHCFSLTTRDAPAEGLLGLSFEPMDGRDLPDIHGTFWVDRGTSELRSIRFEYTGVVKGKWADPPGGEASFLRLPNGAWIVSRWNIRAPLVSYPFIMGLREAGGQVVGIDAPPPE